jgi:hypothetical protein
MIKRIMIFGILITGLVSQGQSSVLSLYDDHFIEPTKDGQPFGVMNNEWIDLPAVWGIWNSSTSIFSPVYNSWVYTADGYLSYFKSSDIYYAEIYVPYYVLQPNIIPAGTLMALGIYDLPYDATFPWSNEAARVILTDPNWRLPLWDLGLAGTYYSFSSNTQAVFGTFTYNGGNEKIGLTTPSVPEPSSLSLLALGGVVVALGRRRK